MGRRRLSRPDRSHPRGRAARPGYDLQADEVQGRGGRVTKEKNKSKSSVRAKVEHILRIVKRIFGFDKVRYRGIANHHRLCADFALVNLYLHRKRLAVLG